VVDAALRPIVDADLDALFEHRRDPEAVRMAAAAWSFARKWRWTRRVTPILGERS